MSTRGHEASADAPVRSDSHPDGRRLGVLLACFAGRETAGKTHRTLEGQLRANGAQVLDTTVFDVDEKQKAHTHDPHRVVWGTLTPALTWGVVGVATGGWKGAVLWGVLGAIAGGFYSYYKIHLATKAQLAYLGSRLPANSSTLLTYAETPDSGSLLKAAASHAPSVASVASIDDDLRAEVVHLTGPGAEKTDSAAPSASPAVPKTLVNMILTRYPDPGGGRNIADAIQGRMKQGMKEVKKEEADTKKAGGSDAKKAFEAQVAKAEAAEAEPEVDFVVNTDRDGKRHVFDPNLGPWAFGKADIAGWGIFCGGCGLIVGLIGNGFWGGVTDAVVAGILGGILGLGAGALYGLWAGRASSARRLRPVGRLLAPGTSLIVAWAGGALRQKGLAELATPDSQQLVVHFDAAAGGMVLDAAPRAA